MAGADGTWSQRQLTVDGGRWSMYGTTATGDDGGHGWHYDPGEAVRSVDGVERERAAVLPWLVSGGWSALQPMDRGERELLTARLPVSLPLPPDDPQPLAMLAGRSGKMNVLVRLGARDRPEDVWVPAGRGWERWQVKSWAKQRGSWFPEEITVLRDGQRELWTLRPSDEGPPTGRPAARNLAVTDTGWHPLTVHEGVPVVQVRIDGETFTLGLATTHQHTELTRRVAAKLRLTPGAESLIDTPAARVRARAATVTELEAGGLVATELPVRIHDSIPAGLDGWLGQSALRACVLGIDVLAGRWTCAATAPVLELHPLDEVHGAPVVTLTAEGRPLRMRLDTAATGITLMAPAVRRTGWGTDRPVSRTADGRVTTVGMASVGPVSLGTLEVLLHADGAGVVEHDDLDGTLGIDVLQSHELWLDQRRGRWGALPTAGVPPGAPWTDTVLARASSPWMPLDDHALGGRSSVTLNRQEDALQVAGELAPAEAGFGWVGVVLPLGGEGAAFDLRAFDALRIRGDFPGGQTFVRLHTASRPGPDHAAALLLEDAADQVVPLDRLAPLWSGGGVLDARDVVAISFVCAGRVQRPVTMSLVSVEFVTVAR